MAPGLCTIRDQSHQRIAWELLSRPVFIYLFFVDLGSHELAVVGLQLRDDLEPLFHVIPPPIVAQVTPHLLWNLRFQPAP